MKTIREIALTPYYPYGKNEEKIIAERIFEVDEALDRREECIRADERAKTIKEMALTIRKIEADTTHCLFDCPRADEPITCTICVLERTLEQLKEQK